MTSVIETIQHAAVDHAPFRAEDVQLPWADGLSQLEQFLSSAKLVVPENNQEAKKLVDAIAKGSGIMIVVVFDKTHTKAVALPLREVHDSYLRTELGVNYISISTDLENIQIATEQVLYIQSKNPETRIQRDVVLIEQNLGFNRKLGVISVTNLNKNIDYSQKGRYMDWIRQVQVGLNRTPVTS